MSTKCKLYKLAFINDSNLCISIGIIIR